METAFLTTIILLALSLCATRSESLTTIRGRSTRAVALNGQKSAVNLSGRTGAAAPSTTAPATSATVDATTAITATTKAAITAADRATTVTTPTETTSTAETTPTTVTTPRGTTSTAKITPMTLTTTTVASSFNQSCFRLQGDTAELKVLPESPKKLYSIGSTVTLVCTTKSATSRVFIHSCIHGPSDVPTHFYSEPSISKTELVIANFSTPFENWSFGCWEIDSRCTDAEIRPLTQFMPHHLECLLSAYKCQECTVSLNFGYGAPPPSNFTCVSENWEGLTCQWTVHSLSDTTIWSVSYRPFCDDDAYVDNCADLAQLSEKHGPFPLMCLSNDTTRNGTTKNISCTIDSEWFHRDVHFYFQVTGENKYGNVQENFTVETNTTIVKFSKVTSLRVDSDDANSTVLHVTWKWPTLANGLEGLECLLHVRSEILCDSPTVIQEYDIPVSEEDCGNSSVTLVGLHPFSKYALWVHIRPQGGVYWSESVAAINITREDVPSAAPEVSPGGHMTWECGDYRCLMLYWKPILSEDRNGKLTEYVLVVNQNISTPDGRVEDKNLTQPIRDVVAVSASVGQITSNASAHVCIFAATSAGPSPEAGCISIPSELDTSEKPDEVYVEQITVNGTYLVTWNAVNTTVDYVTVFWCQGPVYIADTEHIPCKTDMNWRDLDPNATSLTVDVSSGATQLEDGYKWYFGVAFTHNQLSRGIKWNRCVYYYYGNVSSSPNIVATPTADTEVTVTWDFKSCDVTFLRGRPLLYQIYYSRQPPGTTVPCNCTSGRRLDVVPRYGESSAVLKGLSSNATYHVCMSILTRNGQSPVSRPFTVSLLQQQASPFVSGTDNTGIVVGVCTVAGVLLVAGGLVCRKRIKRVSRKFHTTDQHLPRPPRPVRTPPVLNQGNFPPAVGVMSTVNASHSRMSNKPEQNNQNNMNDYQKVPQARVQKDLGPASTQVGPSTGQLGPIMGRESVAKFEKRNISGIFEEFQTGVVQTDKNEATPAQVSVASFEKRFVNGEHGDVVHRESMQQNICHSNYIRLGGTDPDTEDVQVEMAQEGTEQQNSPCSDYVLCGGRVSEPHASSSLDQPAFLGRSGSLPSGQQTLLLGRDSWEDNVDKLKVIRGHGSQTERSGTHEGEGEGIVNPVFDVPGDDYVTVTLTETQLSSVAETLPFNAQDRTQQAFMDSNNSPESTEVQHRCRGRDVNMNFSTWTGQRPADFQGSNEPSETHSISGGGDLPAQSSWPSEYVRAAVRDSTQHNFKEEKDNLENHLDDPDAVKDYGESSLTTLEGSDVISGNEGEIVSTHASTVHNSENTTVVNPSVTMALSTVEQSTQSAHDSQLVTTIVLPQGQGAAVWNLGKSASLATDSTFCVQPGILPESMNKFLGLPRPPEFRGPLPVAGAGKEIINPLKLTPPSAQLRGGGCEHERVKFSPTTPSSGEGDDVVCSTSQPAYVKNPFSSDPAPSSLHSLFSSEREEGVNHTKGDTDLTTDDETRRLTELSELKSEPSDFDREFTDSASDESAETSHGIELTELRNFIAKTGSSNADSESAVAADVAVEQNRLSSTLAPIPVQQKSNLQYVPIKNLQPSGDDLRNSRCWQTANAATPQLQSAKGGYIQLELCQTQDSYMPCTAHSEGASSGCSSSCESTPKVQAKQRRDLLHSSSSDSGYSSTEQAAMMK